jgi:hypothetical protein
MAEFRKLELKNTPIGVTTFLIITVTVFSSIFSSATFGQVQGQGQGQGEQLGTSSFFPNATSRLPGVPTIIPGLHAMSLVNGIKSTWLIISTDNELSLNLRYTGTATTTPAVALFATALKNTTLGQQGTLPQGQSFQRLTGSNVTKAGWVSPLTIPIKLNGGMSLYDADLVIVMIVPLTNSSLAGNNTASSSLATTAPANVS